MIYVGDAVADVKAAYEAGVRTVAAAWASTAVAAVLAALGPRIGARFMIYTRSRVCEA